MSEYSDVRKALIKHFGKEWWMETLKWLKETLNYPHYKEPPDDQLDDFHPIFRQYIKTIFDISNEASASNRLVAFSRMNALKHMRPSLLPQYWGIFCPVFRSRSIGNFGLVNMITEDKMFSRAFYNMPYPLKQKVKRTVISCYGITKHGRKLEDWEQYPRGGVFLVKPDPDPNFDKLSKYVDYSYVTLNWRFPKNYDEFIKTLDGSVLISKSAAKKLRYRKIGYALINNPAKEISEKKLFFITTGKPKEGIEVEYQQPLSDLDTELAQASSVAGKITEVICVNPNTRNPKHRIWFLKIEDERDVEIGCKIESVNGLKHTVADYTKDKEPTIVINPDAFKDRGIYWEVKDTGKIHCYPTIPGKDGNISTRDIRISRTLVQGIFCYPPKVQKQLINAIFNEKTLTFPFPNNILKILENMEKINPDKLYDKYPVFHNFFYYSRVKKIGDKYYLYVEPTQTLRAWRKLYEVKDYNKLAPFYQKALDHFVNLIVKQILVFDTEKKCKIKIEGHIRIILFHSKPEINKIIIGEKLWEKLGKPPYVLFAKEPVTRDLSIRCLEVEVKKDIPEWVCYIHPYLALDHEKDELHTKIDCQPSYAPLLIREDGHTKWTTFKELWDNYSTNPCFDGEKWIAPTKKVIEVRTSNGWQRINFLIKKIAKYDLYRVLATEYFSECSGEHRFIVNNEKIKPHDMLGKDFDINIPEFKELLDLDKDVAWFFGFFAAEGCALPNKHFKIANKNIDFIERCIIAIEKLGYDYTLRKYNDIFVLYIKPTRLAKEYRKLFYVDKNKKLPDIIFYTTKQTLEAVLSGLIDGDGHIYPTGSITYTTKSSILAQQVIYIMKKLGYNYYISIRKDNPNIIQITTTPTNGNYDNPSKGYPDEIRKTAIELYTKGFTQREIADKLNVCQSTVSRWINCGIERKNGVKFCKNRHMVKRLQKLQNEDYVYSLSTPTGDYYDVFILHSNTDGDLAILIPLYEKIPGAMYKKKKRKYNKLWKKFKNATLDNIKHFDGYKSLEEFVIDVYEYNRRESLEQLIMQTFGGIKNRAMFTDLIKDYKKWKEFVLTWDLELRGFQADKLNPELKDAPISKLNEYYEKILHEGLTVKLPDYIEEYKRYRELENVTFKNRHDIRKVLKSLKKSKHPVMKLIYHIYKTLKVI